MEMSELTKHTVKLFPDNSLLDEEVVKRMARRYSEVSDIYMLGLNGSGDMICEMTGNDSENTKLVDYVGTEQLDDLFHRVTDDDLEVQAFEETAVANIRIAGVSVRAGQERVVTWLLFGVINDDDIICLPGSVAPIEYSRSCSLNQFMNAVDVLRDITQMIVSSKYSVANAEAESRRSKVSESEMKLSLRRLEAVSKIVKLLDSDDSIEIISNELVRTCGEFLDITSAFIARVKGNLPTMDIVAEWNNKGIVSCFDKTKDVERFSFISGEKPLVVSFDTDISLDERENMDNMGIKAICVFPISAGNAVSMYACFIDSNDNKKWKTEDVKFLFDVIRILQSVLSKRMQKISLANTYESIENILDNVGTAIYVRDIESGAPLFANKILKNTFASEISEGSLDDLIDLAIPANRVNGVFEINHIDRKKWFELHYTQINWVDDRPVSLYSIYDVTDKKNYQRRIEQQAYTDFLTGLYNRMRAERDLATNIDEAKAQGKQGALMYLDLDDFKHINDGLGHQYGDVLLKEISNSLQRIEGITNTCYRMGGDEFVIIVPPKSFERFEKIIEEIKNIFSKPWYLKSADYYCTMSMGIVEFPKYGESVEDLIKKADIAMYEAKKGGKNRVATYSENITSVSNERLDMEKNMRDAMAADYREFEVYYQPIVDITKGNKCVGAEALIRWNSNELGFINPSDFIPLAEYLGLINPIGNHVLKEACMTCKSWNDNGHPEYKVNVNLSVVQLLQPDIVDSVKDVLDETKINPKNLTLEVTESLAINDMVRMQKILNGIKTLGVKLALDDFGTGYSSLNHIREIPFDVIKVDQTFVKDLSEDAYSQSFIKMVAELAQTIGVNICVEGIETETQFKVLDNMKVKMVQGYYFDKPMTKDAFEKKYVL